MELMHTQITLSKNKFQRHAPMTYCYILWVDEHNMEKEFLYARNKYGQHEDTRQISLNQEYVQYKSKLHINCIDQQF